MTALQEANLAAGEAWGTGIALPAARGQPRGRTRGATLIPQTSKSGSAFHNEEAEHETTSVAERFTKFSIPGLDLVSGRVGGKLGFRPSRSFGAFKQEMATEKAGDDGDEYGAGVTAGLVTKGPATKAESGRPGRRARREDTEAEEWQRRAGIEPREPVSQVGGKTNGKLDRWKYQREDLYVSSLRSGENRQTRQRELMLTVLRCRRMTASSSDGLASAAGRRVYDRCRWH